MSRGPAICALALVLSAGCGGSQPAKDAPVRGLLDRYLRAMVAHDWATACAQLTPELAAQKRFPGLPADCEHGLAGAAGATLGGNPSIHPERAGEELRQVHVDRVQMRGDTAQAYLTFPPGQEWIVLVVRRGGRWLLAQDLEPGIPIDMPSGSLY